MAAGNAWPDRLRRGAAPGCGRGCAHGNGSDLKVNAKSAVRGPELRFQRDAQHAVESNRRQQPEPPAAEAPSKELAEPGNQASCFSGIAKSHTIWRVRHQAAGLRFG